MNIAEKLAVFIAKEGNQSLLIHTIPRSPFWLICQKTKRTKPNWRISIANPLQTSHRLVSEHVTDEEHLELWKKLIELEGGLRMKDTVQTYRKHAENYYTNLKATAYGLQQNSSNSKNRSKRHPALPSSSEAVGTSLPPQAGH